MDTNYIPKSNITIAYKIYQLYANWGKSLFDLHQYEKKVKIKDDKQNIVVSE